MDIVWEALKHIDVSNIYVNGLSTACSAQTEISLYIGVFLTLSFTAYRVGLFQNCCISGAMGLSSS